MSAKIRKITVFFSCFLKFKLLILGLRDLHGNKKFEIEGNFINFKLGDENFFFDVLDFEEGRARNFHKIR